MSASWTRYFFVAIGEDVVRYWFEEKQLKKSQKEFGARILACNVIQNSNEGFARPHVLIGSSTVLSYTVLAFSTINNRRSWSKVAEFEVPRHHSPPSNCFYLFDGPSILWSKGCFIYVACGCDMEITSLNISSVWPSTAISHITIPWFKLEPSSPPVVLVGIQAHLKEKIPGKEFRKREWFTAKIVLQDTPTLALLADTIPGCYGRIVTCVAGFREHFVDQWSGEMEVRDGLVVGTELKQVQVLSNQTVCRVPLMLGRVPHKLATLTSSNGCLVVGVLSEDGETSAHELVKKPAGSAGEDGLGCWTWNKLGEWGGVIEMQTGDFLQTGSDELLILMEEDEFVLTNFGDVNITSESISRRKEGGEEGVASCPRALLDALKGLQLKKHIGEAQLVQYEASEQRRHHLLSRSLSFMEDLWCSNSITPQLDPGLLCVIPGSVHQKNTHSSPSATPVEFVDDWQKKTKFFEVLDVWQKIQEGCWVLGVLLKNISQRPCVGVSLSLLSPDQQLVGECTCRIVWNETRQKKSNLSSRLVARRDPATEPPPSKMRKAGCSDASKEDTLERKELGVYEGSFVAPGDAVCFTLCTSPPPPQPDRTVMVVLLCCRVREAGGMWRTYSEELSHIKLEVGSVCRGDLDIDKKCLDLWQGGRVIVAGNGRRLLSARDFSSPSNTRSLACLLALHCLTQVHVTSKHTHLWRLPSILKAKFPCSPSAIQVGPQLYAERQAAGTSRTVTPTSGTAPDLSGLGVFGAAALHIHLETSSACISVLHRRVGDRASVLKLLRDSLPGDMEMCLLADSLPKEHEQLHRSLSAIVEEAQEKAWEIQEHLVANMHGGLEERSFPSLLVRTNSELAQGCV